MTIQVDFMQALELDPRRLRPNPWNSNRVTPENMEKLKRSIEDLGFASAVVVRETEEGFEILGGQHRTEAAIELGLKKIPVVNVGVIEDKKARKIGLVDNHRYGNDDVMQLAKIIEEIGEDANDLVNLLPVSKADIDAVIGAVDLDLEGFDLAIDDDDDGPPEKSDTKSRTEKTHDVLKFRCTMRDAEAIRQLIEKTIKRQGLAAGDEMTTAGEALALLILKDDEE